MSHRRSYWWSITLGVVMIVLLVALTVGWVLLTVLSNTSNSAGYWALLAVGTTFFGLVLAGVIMYLVLSVREIRLNQRQSNFIASVTHELKSPLASLKLYLQTMGRRSVTEQQQADFRRFMLDDLERLDTLINHMLDAARVDQQPVDAEVVDVELTSVIRSCANMACLRYRAPPETVRLDLEPVVVRGRPIDLEMVFRNLLDNAVKYAGDPPEVEVSLRGHSRGTAIALITDNGPGIPARLRRKLFGRFVRLGNELERSKPGTGLGLFIARTLVRRMGGAINVRGRGSQSGTTFEVELPSRAPVAAAVEVANSNRG